MSDRTRDDLPQAPTPAEDDSVNVTLPAGRISVTRKGFRQYADIHDILTYLRACADENTNQHPVVSGTFDALRARFQEMTTK